MPSIFKNIMYLIFLGSSILPLLKLLGFTIVAEWSWFNTLAPFYLTILVYTVVLIYRCFREED